MSESSPASPAASAPQAVRTAEFFARLNDVIAVANRIGRKHDTSHAQVVLAHALARYSAHHYKSTVKADSPEERQRFGSYMGGLLTELIGAHMPEVMGDAPAEPGPQAAE